MTIPGLIKVCEKDPARRKKIAEDLDGAWLSDKVLGVPGIGGIADFPLNEIIRADHSANVGLVFDLPRQLSNITGDVTGSTFWRQGAPLITGRNVVFLEILERIVKKPFTQKSYCTRVSNGIANRPNYILLEPAHAVGMSGELMFVYALYRRTEFGIHLLQAVRILGRLLNDGYLNAIRLRAVCKTFDSPFVSATISLAIRGLKSKRHIPRRLILGEEVCIWHDITGSLPQVYSKTVLGTVASDDSATTGMVLIHHPRGNDRMYNYGYVGRYDVWPKHTIPTPKQFPGVKY